MSRIKRVVVPDMPHHVMHSGNRGADVFFDDQDRRQYLALLGRYARRHALAIWAYCLMPDHVHFVAVPAGAESLGHTFRDTHRAYATWLNRKTRERGHLWQGRFGSCVLDDEHLWVCVRYVERNPVRAGLVDRAQDWPWSSAAAHCGLKSDPLLSRIRMADPAAGWETYLRQQDPEHLVGAIRRNTRTGRPCGRPGFTTHLESVLSRRLAPQKPGRKPKKTRKNGDRSA